MLAFHIKSEIIIKINFYSENVPRFFRGTFFQKGVARLTKKMEKDFTVVHNEFIRDKSLGLTARGLLLTMLSMSDSFSFSIKGLASIVPDGETKVSSALKELERCGYLRRQRIFADNGRFLDVEYSISDEPIFLEDTPEQETPYRENPNVDETHAENHDVYKISKLSSTKESNTDLLTINQSISKNEDKKGWIDKIEWEQTKQLVEEQIEADIILQTTNSKGHLIYNAEQVNELIHMISFVRCTTQKSIRINGMDMDTEIVRSMYSKLNSEHIMYVLDCLKANSAKITARQNYLLTALYNAPISMEGFYDNLVHHDMCTG